MVALLENDEVIIKPLGFLMDGFDGVLHEFVFDKVRVYSQAGLDIGLEVLHMSVIDLR